MKKGAFLKIIIDAPSSIAEQRKIADFLGALDVKIANAEAQLELARSYKRGLLQQMFV